MSLELAGPAVRHTDEVCTPDALAFVADLARRFEPARRELLDRRLGRRAALAAGDRLDFLAQTEAVRADPDWRVAPAPADLTDRRVEITGPTDAKMAINALNSGAKVFMADFEDANAPTWANLVGGQYNLTEAIERRLEFTGPDGRHYALGGHPAVLLVRPRGWHLPERHLLLDGSPVAGALVDFGLYVHRNTHRLLAAGTGPYFYLPKLESHLEARLWNDVFRHAQDALGVPRGSIRATVLIETIPAAFEMEEILYELREHASGLNAGRWDYMFSVIKNFRDAGPDFVLPDRNAVTMTVPFMRAYTELLVATCHRRGAFAMGGMAAFIPSRRDQAVNEAAFAKVREDKDREAGDGFDGTWVAHPDLVAVAQESFDRVLGGAPNQLHRLRDDVKPDPDGLLAVRDTPGSTTSDGLRNDVAVGLRYLAAWLAGSGAVGIFNLMEDAATAEIARSQVWQWVHTGVTLDDGERVSPDLVRRIIDEELARVRDEVGADSFSSGRYQDARAVFERVALDDEFVDFLTLPAYELLD